METQHYLELKGHTAKQLFMNTKLEAWKFLRRVMEEKSDSSYNDVTVDGLTTSCNFLCDILRELYNASWISQDLHDELISEIQRHTKYAQGIWTLSPAIFTDDPKFYDIRIAFLDERIKEYENN